MKPKSVPVWVRLVWNQGDGSTTGTSRFSAAISATMSESVMNLNCRGTD
jgi:hypothetical protein